MNKTNPNNDLRLSPTYGVTNRAQWFNRLFVLNAPYQLQQPPKIYSRRKQPFAVIIAEIRETGSGAWRKRGVLSSMCSQLCFIIIVNMNLCWYSYTDGNIIMLEWNNRDMLIITQIALLQNESSDRRWRCTQGIIITMWKLQAAEGKNRWI